MGERWNGARECEQPSKKRSARDGSKPKGFWNEGKKEMTGQATAARFLRVNHGHANFRNPTPFILF